MREIARYVQGCRTHEVAQTKATGVMHAMAIHRSWQQVMLNLVGLLPVAQGRATRGCSTYAGQIYKVDRITPLPPRRRPRDHRKHRRGHNLATRMPGDYPFLRSAQLEKLLKTYIRHIYTLVHAPQCNLVECINRTIKTMLAQFSIAIIRTVTNAC